MILGAARSGTKFFRDTLGADSRAHPIPYDINFVWRIGNEKHPDDALPSSLASPRICRLINQRLRALVGDPNLPRGHFLIEKTVSNTLRVPFVDQVLPNAKFVHLLRDGREVSASAFRCWQERTPLKYAVLKAQYFSMADWRYIADSFRNFMVGQIVGRGGGKVWGPRYPGVDDDVSQLPLEQVCARQWLHCVTSTIEGLEKIDSARHITVRYEDLIFDDSEIGRVCDFLGLETKVVSERYQRTVKRNERNVLSDSLTSSLLDQVSPTIEPLLRRLGYI